VLTYRFKNHLFVLAFLCLASLLSACASAPTTTQLSFMSGGNQLQGEIYLPEGQAPFPAVIFVAGDGDIPRDAHGYYKPYIKLFNELGYAAVSWDKPGVGKSTGQWLKQSMDDREEEVRAAILELRQNPNIKAGNIGLIGFSQAGWVMPGVLGADDRLSFMVMVSPAINWQQQGNYMMEGRLKLEGSPPCCESVMSPERWEFVTLNARIDASAELQGVKQPILAIFGDKDLNVDFKESARVISGLGTGSKGCKPSVVIVENADHSLLPAEEPRLVTANADMISRLIKIEFIGADAFAPGSLSEISSWVEDLTKLSEKCF